jgi:hypothetical protein
MDGIVSSALHGDFHKDGIVSEESFLQESIRLLYVLLEPNSKGGRYDRFRGHDLRKIWGEIGLGKPVDLNLARWTRVLLDGVAEYPVLDAHSAKVQLRRVAIMNLKKLAGSGTANLETISILAWADREFIRREVSIIAPTLVVTCGASANRLFGKIIMDDPLFEAPPTQLWTHGNIEVMPANHPSLRPLHARSAFERVVSRASEVGISARETLG